jgi:hypothetical protein
VPVVPIQLQGKFFRGIQINQGYKKGEWTANFTKTGVTVVDPHGTTKSGNVAIVGQYLVISWTDSTITSSLWQYLAGPETDFFSWAWSTPNGDAPATFDSAMTTAGETEYEFMTCAAGHPCHFPKSS